MQIEHHTPTHSIELRLLDLEDTVTALTTIVSTMTEMLGRLNEIAGHYADHVTESLHELPQRGRRILPMWPTDALSPTTPVHCTNGCGCATSADTPEAD